MVAHRMACWALGVAVVVVAPWLFSGSLGVTVLSQMGIAIVTCLSFNLLLGQGGMLSFGHATYTGCGAFAAIHVLQAGVGAPWAVPVVVVPLLGGMAGMALAALLGWVCTRRGGTVFAMITLGLGELVYAASLMLPQWFGGEAGISANRASGAPWWGLTFGPAREVYYLVAGYTLVSAAALYAFTRTPLGRLLQAVRDNAERLEFVGYSAQTVRYLAFVVAGFFAGIAGALGAIHFETVNAEVFSASKSGAVLLFTFVGGTAAFYGPIVGGVLMVLSTVLLSGLTPAWLLYLGLLFMAVVVWVPGGLASCVPVLVQLVRSGQSGPGVRLLLRLAPGALACGAGVAALVEMLYHRQMGAAVGPEITWLQLRLDTAALQVWLGALALALAGGLLLAVQRKACATQWRRMLDAAHAR